MARAAAAMSKPPPPRYRIVERGGRLVTIDTWAKASSTTPPAQPPVRPRSMQPPRGPSGLADRGLPATLGSKLVRAVLRVQGENGRPLLTTDPNWDRKGPRTIALSAAGERRLGGLLLVIALLASGLLAAAIANPATLMPFAIAAAVIFGATAKSGAPLLTRFLDSLGEDWTG